MSRGANIAKILVNSNGEIQAPSLTNVYGSVFTSEAPVTTFSSGSAVQVKSTLYQWYNTLAVNNTWQNVPNLSVDITPRTATSIFKIEVRWFGEMSSAWNMVFGITRNGTLINMPTQEGSRNTAIGMPCQTYIADDNNSTPELSYMMTYDSPNTSSTITYRLVARHYDGGTLYTGRVYDGSVQGSNYEQGSTEVIVTEYLA
jgi:hypothetical protein